MWAEYITKRMGNRIKIDITERSSGRQREQLVHTLWKSVSTPQGHSGRLCSIFPLQSLGSPQERHCLIQLPSPYS